MLKFISAFLFLFVIAIVACADKDPGETVNHVHLGKYIIDLTFGPLATFIVAPFLLWGMKVIVSRQLKAHDDEKAAAAAKEEEEKRKQIAILEEHKKDAIRLKAQLEKERHEKVIDMIAENRSLVGIKIDKVCKQLADQDARFRNHGHNIDTEKGQTKDVIHKWSYTPPGG
jgi:hypothetical protein